MQPMPPSDCVQCGGTGTHGFRDDPYHRYPFSVMRDPVRPIKSFIHACRQTPQTYKSLRDHVNSGETKQNNFQVHHTRGHTEIHARTLQDLN